MDEDIDLPADFRSFPWKGFEELNPKTRPEVLFFKELAKCFFYFKDLLKPEPGLIFDFEIGGSFSIFWSFRKTFSSVVIVILLSWSFVAEL